MPHTVIQVPIYIELFFAYIELTYLKFLHISRKFFALKKSKYLGLSVTVVMLGKFVLLSYGMVKDILGG